mgnify:CR=1 FL=1
MIRSGSVRCTRAACSPSSGRSSPNCTRLAAKSSASLAWFWLVGGTIPLCARDAGKVRSACLLFDDRGERVARYDKMHLFDVHLLDADERYVESATIEPGDGVVAFKVQGKGPVVAHLLKEVS